MYKKMLVKDLPENVIFLSDSQDVQVIKDYLGNKYKSFDSCFVVIGDGDYDEIYIMTGIIPFLVNDVYRVK